MLAWVSKEGRRRFDANITPRRECGVRSDSFQLKKPSQLVGLDLLLPL